MSERQKLYEMLESVESAMLVTHNPDGILDARPMRVADVEPAGVALVHDLALQPQGLRNREGFARAPRLSGPERPVSLGRRYRAHR